MSNFSKSSLFRHFVVFFFSLALFYFFWASRPDWSFDMRLWRSFGDTAFVLLFLVLLLGPLSKFWKRISLLLLWRRELGIWFSVSVFVHGILILDGWVRWDFMRFFGYEFIPQLDRYARIEPGFGLANLAGIIALFFVLILAFTSSNKAVKFLGSSSWKWLHAGVYTVFYLSVIHVGYFLFMHFTPSFHRPVPSDQNWFAYYFLFMALFLFFIQFGAFIKTVLSRKNKV